MRPQTPDKVQQLRSKRPLRPTLRAWQVLLTGADGLDFPTSVDCGVIYLVPKTACSPALGSVGHEYRRRIGRRINEVLRLSR